ncbi:hypothetical protein SAMN05216548_101530 [Faunimonas pinastri]|uniref:Uncharacterized protein n=1 Tax=Faunimonas pinastri TaxID=1855383 RepID=A0A1H9AWN4_9HYPH|nr:hypothetical protein [Faunimonas pinastri]SEP80348.1 hypothetical protein SAMN05216548_101530 [Faunimonas pinastri]
MKLRSLLSASLLLAGLPAIAAAPALAADMPYYATETTTVTAVPSQCADTGILSRIEDHYNWSDQHTWHRGILIAALQEPRPQVGGVDNPSMIPKERCTARAVFNNGQSRPVYYVIEKGMGYASVGRGVDFCVDGLDPWRVHDGDCRTVR